MSRTSERTAVPSRVDKSGSVTARCPMAGPTQLEPKPRGGSSPFLVTAPTDFPNLNPRGRNRAGFLVSRRTARRSDTRQVMADEAEAASALERQADEPGNLLGTPRPGHTPRQGVADTCSEIVRDKADGGGLYQKTQIEGATWRRLGADGAPPTTGRRAQARR